MIFLYNDHNNRLQKDNAKDTRIKLQANQNQHRNFSLLNYKWSWQGQAADIFNKIPADLKEIGRTTSWSKIKAAGKAILNKTASPKAKIQNHCKLNHKTQAAVNTGNSGLNNKLNANLFNWIDTQQSGITLSNAYRKEENVSLRPHNLRYAQNFVWRPREKANRLRPIIWRPAVVTTLLS